MDTNRGTTPMPTSDARIEANRRNSLLSTGPKTSEGKARSRANALKDGFTASELRTDRDQAVAASFASLGGVAQEVAITLDRLDRLRDSEVRERERVILRASNCWNGDRMLEAEALGEGLARRPSEVMARLQSFPQGCRWMIHRWSKLARIADVDHGWDEAERALAFDLLGVPKELRKGHPGESLTDDGQVQDEGNEPSLVARTQVARLQALAESLVELEEFDWETACQGLQRDDGPTARRLRSYELALHRRLKQLWKHGDDEVPALEPEPVLARQVEAEPVVVENEAKLDEVAVEAPKENEAKIGPISRRDRWSRQVEKRRASADRKLARRVDQVSRASGSAG